jgi:Zn-dependent protease with chaperone function
MIGVLRHFLTTDALAESNLLADMRVDELEWPDWSASVKGTLEKLLTANLVTRPCVCKVIDYPVANAFALPLQTILLTQPLVELCRGERDQLAFVLAHELAHQILGHASARSRHEAILSMAPIANPLLGMGLQLLFSRAMSREHEFQADDKALSLVQRAGFSLRAAVQFLARLEELSHSEGSLLGEWLSTHPPLADRIRTLQSSRLFRLHA